MKKTIHDKNEINEHRQVKNKKYRLLPQSVYCTEVAWPSAKKAANTRNFIFLRSENESIKREGCVKKPEKSGKRDCFRHSV